MKKQDIALKKTADLWNAFMDIPITEVHSDDTNDFRHHLHALQNILYTQLYKNQDPVFKVEFHSSDLRIWTNNLLANGGTTSVTSDVKTF